MCGWPWTADGGGPGGVALPCRAVNLRCAAARSAAPNGRRCAGRYAALGEGWVRPARTVVSVTLARATAARCRRRMSTGSNGRLRAHRSPLRVTPPQRSHSRTEILMTTTLVTSNSGTAEVQGRQGDNSSFHRPDMCRETGSSCRFSAPDNEPTATESAARRPDRGGSSDRLLLFEALAGGPSSPSASGGTFVIPGVIPRVRSGRGPGWGRRGTTRRARSAPEVGRWPHPSHQPRNQTTPM